MDLSPTDAAPNSLITDAAVPHRSGPGRTPPGIPASRGHRVSIDVETMRELTARHPLYVIARMYACSTRTIALLAAEYGLVSTFVRKNASEDEIRIIRAGMEAGRSVKSIAEEIGRSHDLVARHVKALATGGGVLSREQPGRPKWPRVETSAEEALRGRRFEDASADLINRECPPGKLPLNGIALAAVGRFSTRSYTRSAADLCMEA